MILKTTALKHRGNTHTNQNLVLDKLPTGKHGDKMAETKQVFFVIAQYSFQIQLKRLSVVMEAKNS